MKDYLLELTSKQTGFNAKLNSMREYLQAYTLRFLHEEGLFRTAAFLGGTALRFLYDLPRFSEDLDFSIVKGADLRFTELIKKLKSELLLAGYSVTVTYTEAKTVHDAFIKFEGLMYEVGISPLKSQKFSIKIEIDTNPPDGAILKTYLITKHFPISFLSYDTSSLFAGKMHALMSRRYTKGRDFFDLGWYLSRWKSLLPNFILLQNSLKQSNWKEAIPTEENWRSFISKIVHEADWDKVKQDVQNFLENPQDLNIFTKENILNLLKGDF